MSGLEAILIIAVFMAALIWDQKTIEKDVKK